jgi:hypothetical protein
LKVTASVVSDGFLAAIFGLTIPLALDFLTNLLPLSCCRRHVALTWIGRIPGPLPRQRYRPVVEEIINVRVFQKAQEISWER